MTLYVEMTSGQPAVKIFASQSDYLPNANNFDYEYRCTEICTIRLTKEEVDPHKKIYLAFETEGALKVIASAEEAIITEIFENEQVKGFLEVLTGKDE